VSLQRVFSCCFVSLCEVLNELHFGERFHSFVEVVGEKMSIVCRVVDTEMIGKSFFWVCCTILPALLDFLALGCCFGAWDEQLCERQTILVMVTD
jgi:hypothetical protein